ncbi:MAG: hypothetical protein U9N45_08565 [Gemmatimonadota bacterium]|nr:hypothetical protein [Gemmatimonadota bacterium]
MKYNSSEIHNEKLYHNKQEDHVIRALEHYLSENFLFLENYQHSYPFKIVEYQMLKHGIIIKGYSAGFLKRLNKYESEGINIDQIHNSIMKLKETKQKLYESLEYLWGKPINTFGCHKSTVHRRLNKALKFIAINTGLLNKNTN